MSKHLRLDRFDNSTFERGRGKSVELLWLIFSSLFVGSGIPGSRHRRWILRVFGAEIGEGVVIKPYVRVKFPWRLAVGDYSWIGESVWIDNLAQVTIGSHAVISQGAYLCTGSHDWASETFDLITRDISIGDSTWICAQARIAPGVVVPDRSIVPMGSVVDRSHVFPDVL